MATMANQQRSVIITAIILAIILGGVLVWLLNRTPADQLGTESPEPTVTPEELVQTQPTPTEIPIETVSPEPAVQGVSATAPTGAGLLGLTALSGLGGLGVILAFFKGFRR